MSLLDNPIHIAFLLVIVLLVFGAKRLPEIGRSLGSGMRGFRDSLTGDSTTQPEMNAGELAATRVALQGAAVAPAGDVLDPVAAGPNTHRRASAAR